MPRRAACLASFAILFAFAPRVDAAPREDAAPGEDERSYQTPYEAGFRANERGQLVYRDREARWTATLLPDGRVHFEDDLGPHFDKRRGLVGPGLSDLIPAARHYEFKQARKRALLRATAAMRAEMAVEYGETNIEQRLAELEQDLKGVWQGQSMTVAARRELIFERWDECEEAPESEHGDIADERTSRIDTVRQLVGAHAREEIVAFVRRYAPEGSADAYTETELRELNERRLSRARFDPYAARP